MERRAVHAQRTDGTSVLPVWLLSEPRWFPPCIEIRADSGVIGTELIAGICLSVSSYSASASEFYATAFGPCALFTVAATLLLLAAAAGLVCSAFAA